MVQEELVAFAEAAGLELDKSNNAQALAACRVLFAAAERGLSPYSSALAERIGGYPQYAVVVDAAGKFWVSSAAANKTVPGAEGAQWVDFFATSGAVIGKPSVLAAGDVAGSLLYYAAAQKSPVFVYGTTTVALATTTALSSALGGYLPLAGGNVKGNMDWGDKAAASTITHRFWSAGAPAEGDATPDAELTVSGGTPGTANQGSVALSAKELDLSGTEQVLVPDVEDFATKQALSAQIADERYPASVPTTGQARITSLVQDADGRTLSNGAVLANLADLPIAPTDKIQRFTVTEAVYEQTITYPEAFSSEDVTLIMTAQAVDDSAKGLVLPNYRSGTKTPTGFGIRLEYTNGYGNEALPSAAPATVDIIAIGPK